MSAKVITVDALGKRYRLRHQQSEAYTALRDVLARAAGAPLRRLRRPATPAAASVEDFWALKDVGFEVAHGDVLGIVGRNGAGKSTLLKILSRITEPTEGRIVLRGRAASLLEVGTGFHPELTGRENIFLNGSILGMSRAEITRKFDEIVAFAGTERFLDTPVKRYSSGMYVRLAFAVAAHLEPEILIVDEVLAVGDAEFQHRCLGKMNDVAQSGRTVLFVSHQLAAVQNLCRTGLWLDQGRVRMAGPVADVLMAYASGSPQPQRSLLERTDRRGSGALRFAAAYFLDDRRRPVDAVMAGRDATFVMRMQPAAAALRGLQVSIGINNAFGQRVTTWSSEFVGGLGADTPAGGFTITVRVPRLSLMPAPYTYNLYATAGGDVVDWLVSAGGFTVDPGDYYGTGQLPGAADGLFISDHAIELSDEPAPS